MPSSRYISNDISHSEPESQSITPEDHEATQADAHNDFLKKLVKRTHQRAERWRDALTVSIGRARELTELEETRIRYFEELGALTPTKLAGSTGTNRLYTLGELRCLYALGLLVKEYGYRPQAAALLVKSHRELIEFGRPDSLRDLVENEGDAVADGFLLARLMSQLIDAAQAELAPLCHDGDAEYTDRAVTCGSSLRVVGIIVPGRDLVFDARESISATVQQIGRSICKHSKDMLIALDRAAFFEVDSEESGRGVYQTSVRNDSTILLYSRDDAWDIPISKHHHFCFYRSSQNQQLSMWLILTGVENEPPPSPLRLGQQRGALVDRLLAMCERLLEPFVSSSLVKYYRYRSDGFQIEHSQQMYRALLKIIADLIFHDSEQCAAALLIPNSLDHPTTLNMLADYNYPGELVSRVKLNLNGAGQGLCGRAYNLREPFYSSDTRHDDRVAYALEEHSRAALAIPLIANGCVSPVGVLYLASQSTKQTLQSEDAYFALILGSILAEQLGRWWLTRLRKTHDRTLHEHMNAITRWFDSLDPHGRDFQEAIDNLQSLWRTIDANDVDADASNIALILFDIDSYRQNVQLRSVDTVPLEAQIHVRKAIQKIVPNTRDYWFKNDHALVILHNCDCEQACAFAKRIANQVRAIPVGIQGSDGKNITLTVSGAIKVMTYRELHDLDITGDAQFRVQIQKVLDHLREQTARSAPHSLQLLQPTGWMSV